jgi:hypothetical protein
MNSLILPVLISWGMFYPDPSNVLETESIFDWSAPPLAGFEFLVTRDGAPLTVSGYNPMPGWGSFDSLSVKTPLEAGVWGNGNWELDFLSSAVPDSSFESEIGLVENTDSRNRYSALLRRPILSFMKADMSMAREDTLSNQRLMLRVSDFTLGGRGWDTEQRGYALWTGWSIEDLRLRLTFAHFRSGGAYWEAMGDWQNRMGFGTLDVAASASLADDSLYLVQAHARFQAPVAGMDVIARTDLVDDDGELQAGGSAGVLLTPWILRLQGGVAVKPGDEARILGFAGAGPLDLYAESGEDEFVYGLQTAVRTDFGLLNAGCAVGEDTLSFAGTLMPCLRWGQGGRLYGGISWQVTDTDSTTSGTLDLKSSFTLGRFAFIFAVEDVVDDWRSYSFGVTWTFSDRRHFQEIGERE